MLQEPPILPRMLISSLALTHSPWQVQFYCLHFGGGTLSALAELQEFEPFEGAVQGIVALGPNFGVHLLMTATRRSEVHHAMRDQNGTRLELRLGDSVDSVVDLRLAATVPPPGRVLTVDRLHFLAAVPRIDGVADPTSLADGVRALVSMVDNFWPGQTGDAGSHAARGATRFGDAPHRPGMCGMSIDPMIHWLQDERPGCRVLVPAVGGAAIGEREAPADAAGTSSRRPRA